MNSDLPPGETVENKTQVPPRLFPAAERIGEIQHHTSLPSSTYRLQFNKNFTFTDACAIVPYLARLGVTHCYASPFLKSRAGSQHGYDIVDHGAFNPEIGTEEQFRKFVADLHDNHMGLILDIVPNHMAVATGSNPWWMDVLEDGPSSPYAQFFDIDWMPLKPDLAHKVLLPVLGDQFGKVLEAGQLVLTFEQGGFSLFYFDRRFPIATRSVGLVLRHRLNDLTQMLGDDNPHLIEYQSILTAISHLPPRTEADEAKIAEGRREREVIRRRLNSLCEMCPEIHSFLNENIRIFNGKPDDPRSFDLLDQLLLDQAYRLAFWRVAADEINYRRFFDVNELAAIRMENPAVFQAAHQLIFRLVKDGLVDGLRIDHPDGLYDPLNYFTQLVSMTSSDGNAQTPVLAPSHFYLVVEKILGRSEQLPDEWPVHGTTGYDFLNAVNGLFVDRLTDTTFNAIYSKFIHEPVNFKALAYRCKKLIMDASMSSEISVLGHELDRLSEQDRSSRDFTLRGLTDALREVIACFPVYRTYITQDGVPDRDRKYVEQAVSRAIRMNPAVSESIFNFVRDTLLLKFDDHIGEESRAARLRFVSRFQQVTSPVMAKAVEDTAFYINNRLVSLNEVGGDPERFGVVASVFHQQNLDRMAHWPYAMLASSTHDTKRSEDVRARINVLSELPREWRTHVFRWSRLNQRKKTEIDGELAPSRNDEYLLYQTLVGTWPMTSMTAEAKANYINRIQQYMLKATHEAKVHTSWISPHTAYEEALNSFIAEILDGTHGRSFTVAFDPFARRIAEFGLGVSLGQTLFKLTCPGVPDIYQGTELCDLSLVDPDNRRPVDFQHRDALLRTLEQHLKPTGVNREELISDLVQRRHDGTLKLFAIWRALTCRRQYPEVFSNGAYIPLAPTGHRQDNACAFARHLQGTTVIAVVSRFMTQFTRGDNPLLAESLLWENTALPLTPDLNQGRYRNLLTDQIVDWNGAPPAGIPMAKILGPLPIALLLNES